MFMTQSQGIGWQAQYLLGSRHHRIDYDLPDNTWKLDSVELIPRLFHIGHQEAHNTLKDLRYTFFSEPAPQYKPYDPVYEDYIASQSNSLLPPCKPPASV
jgi:uncharacterized protein